MDTKSRRWAVQAIGGANGAGSLGAELLNVASKLSKIKAVVAVDLSFFQFKNLDTNVVCGFVYSGVGMGAGIMVGMASSFADISADVDSSFNFNDLDGAFGRITTVGAGYVAAVGGSLTYASASRWSGSLFYASRTSGLNLGVDSLSIGAQAQTTVGRWWLLPGQKI